MCYRVGGDDLDWFSDKDDLVFLKKKIILTSKRQNKNNSKNKNKVWGLEKP